MMADFLAGTGAFCARHRWAVVVVWGLVLVSAVLGAARYAQPASSQFSVPGLQSVQTLDRVEQEFGSGGDGGKVVFAGDDPAAVAALGRALDAVPAVVSVAPPTLSPRGDIGYLAVTLSGDGPASRATRDGVAAAMGRARASGLRVEATSGLAPADDASGSQGIGVVIALIVLLITFGSLTAAGLPLVTAILGLGVSMALIRTATAVVTLNSVAPTLAILLGLAVGIDYSLFIVDRHRQQLIARGRLPTRQEVHGSIRLALGTAGTAVLFAAVTVVIALAGLCVVGIGFLTQMGLAGAGAVLVAMLASLTLTPALLGLAGTRVLGRRVRRRQATGTGHRFRGAGRGRRWAELVGRHRIVAAALSLAVLAVLAAPVLSMRLGLPDDGSAPSGTTGRKAYDLIGKGFRAGANGPLLVLAQFPGTVTGGRVTAVRRQLSAADGVVAVLVSGTHGRDALLTVIPASGPTDTATETLVRAIRARSTGPAGVTLLVTGQTAVAIDISHRLLDALPPYLTLVAGFALLLLLVIFRSVLIPLKATSSFLLSLGAALGSTVAVFQWGWAGDLFGVDPARPLLCFLPTIVTGVLFGLSMDYEMFLVSGMRERHAHGSPAREAVARGFQQGAKAVVAAALIMIGVFGGGMVTGSSTIRPIAFALAVGVLVDAFLMRLVLVPAAMALFGTAAWWLPRRLAKILPQIDVERAGPHTQQGPPERGEILIGQGGRRCDR